MDLLELEYFEAKLEELYDALNCGEYRVDFNKVESQIQKYELLIEDLKMELA